MPGFGSAPPLPARESSRAPPTWRAAIAGRARARDRAAPRRRQQPRRLGRTGNGTPGLGRLGHDALARRPLAHTARAASTRPPAWAGRLPPADLAALRFAPVARRRCCRPSPPIRSASRPRRARTGPRLGRRQRLRGANRAMRTHLFEPAGYPDDVPVTIAWGERDRLARTADGRAPPGRRSLPVLPDVGHTPTWDDPAPDRPHPARG